VTAQPAAVVVDHEVAAYPSGSRVWRALGRNPSFWLGSVMVVLIVAAAALAPVLAPHDPDQQFRREGLDAHGDPIGPSPGFPLGTDLLGRDELSRLLYGARSSLTVGIVANVLATLIGVIVGSVAAFAGRRVLRIGRRNGPAIRIVRPPHAHGANTAVGDSHPPTTSISGLSRRSRLSSPALKWTLWPPIEGRGTPPCIDHG